MLLTSIAICLLLSLTGFYYALFACYFLTIAGVWASLCRRSVAPALTAGLLIGVIALGLLVDLLPTLRYRHQHGVNTEVAKRQPYDAEVLGLKIDQMLLPIPGHRLPPLARLRERYDAGQPAPNENGSSSLGLFGSLGFLLLLGCLTATGSSWLPDDLKRLAVLNLAALLLGTVGGFGGLIALLLSPMVRGYNRISIYIAFFAIFAVTSCLDRLYRRYARSGRPRLLGALGLGLVLVVALLDQTSPCFRSDYSAVKAAFDRDGRFVRQIEAAVPPASMVFQLPYQPFPEHQGPHRMGDYQPLKGYLHSRTLRWSYASMIGREGDRWQRKVVAKPVPEMVQALSAAGFRGIYLDRDGYPDGGAEIDARLSALLRIRPIESDDHRRAFYPLAPIRAAIVRAGRGIE
jgi:phosphoglycerol transferase